MIRVQMKPILLLAVLAMFIGACNSTETQLPLDNAKVTILYTSNIGGKIETCGCRPPMGGLAKRATVLDGVRMDAKNLLIVDSGGMLFSKNYLYEPYDYVEQIYAHTLNKSMAMIGIDAINVSSYDLANSADSLLIYARDEGTNWISSNVVWKDSGELVFPSSRIVDAGEVKIGVFGVMSQTYRGVDILHEDAKVTVTDPVEAAKKMIADMKGQVHLFVALSYMDYEEAKQLAQQVPDINVMVVSHKGPHTPSSTHHDFHAFYENDTIIVRCPDGGRVVGRLDIDIVDGSLKFVENNKPIILMPNGEPMAATESQFRNQFYDLNPDMPRKRDVQELVDWTEAISESYRDSLGIN